ncbi:MAG: RNA-binding transcriptional accessory protein [Magnetococcales bacterium]|nr:RNA-binding transcriptional accessory protein [Magnetococcales bacterium]
MNTLAQRIATTLNVRTTQVEAAISLLDEGATVPFIARYRKEATQGLTDTHLRDLQDRLSLLRTLDKRRLSILETIGKQGRLTPELEQRINGVESPAELEDLYLPYRPKRRTKATVAREAGLEPLADALLRDPARTPEQHASPFINPEKEVPDTGTALEGARAILVERLSEDSDLIGTLREILWNRGLLCSRLIKSKEKEGERFRDYFEFSEPLRSIPSHRTLAILRGRKEGVLRHSIMHPDDRALGKGEMGFCERQMARHFNLHQRNRPGDAWRMETLHQAWMKKLRPHLENGLIKQLTENAHEEAIRVFGRNLNDLLMAAPAGDSAVIGLDPGLRTGVKVAVVDKTGKVVATTTIYPHPPRNQWSAAISTLTELVKRHKATLFSIGNGTGSRETMRLVTELKQQRADLAITPVIVNEAGASVYSASAFASNELPELDVSLRGAVSIARRLQDPLAELVKIEPRAIGVGQYQHDVDENRLSAALDGVVEDAVNAVGVDVNTASAPLLKRISGLNDTLARNIINYRDEHGPFRSRTALKSVPRFGPKTFEQAAGFLRILNGTTALDASAVHPESYPVVKRMVARLKKPLEEAIGNGALLATLDPAAFVDARFGEPTIRDILNELEKPGRDPRPGFKTAAFREGVESIGDLKPGMVLEGVVSNVTNFGAFVDVGVHQDGLVHISAMADRFVKDPHQITKAGAVVTVKVISVDPARKRIGLSMRLDDDPTSAPSSNHRPPQNKKSSRRQTRPTNSTPQNRSKKQRHQTQTSAMADAFARAKRK